MHVPWSTRLGVEGTNGHENVRNEGSFCHMDCRLCVVASGDEAGLVGQMLRLG